MNEFLENYDLAGVYVWLCVVGVIASLWCHQLWGRCVLGAENPNIVHALQRVAFIVLALALVWSLSYMHVRAWQPWPPFVLTLIAVDLYLASILLAAALKDKKTSVIKG